jgi:hypothetical protein
VKTGTVLVGRGKNSASGSMPPTTRRKLTRAEHEKSAASKKNAQEKLAGKAKKATIAAGTTSRPKRARSKFDHLLGHFDILSTCGFFLSLVCAMTVCKLT